LRQLKTRIRSIRSKQWSTLPSILAAARRETGGDDLAVGDHRKVLTFAGRWV
jgi:hypothetical protein